MKKIISILLAVALLLTATLSLASCSFAPFGETDSKTIRIGASPTPHAEILEVVKDVLAAKGYTLEIVSYDDYVLPNTAVESGELDANYFQHLPYLNDFNSKNNTHLVSVAKIHYEPFGLYANGVDNLANVADGATIIIPNDGSNQTRALFLLAQEGLITLPASATVEAGVTVLDIASNPHNFEIVPVEASTVPAQLRNSDTGSLAVINGNYAIGAGLRIADALATESTTGEAAQTYANIIVVKDGNQNLDKIKALIEAFSDPSVKQYIQEHYNGAVVPMN